MVEKNNDLERMQAELTSLRNLLAARDEELVRLGAQLADARAMAAGRKVEVEALRRDIRVARSLLGGKDATVEAVQSSLSWRITAPLRGARALFARLTGQPRAKTIVEVPVNPGETVGAASKVCIFAHYDKKPLVADYVFALLNGISAAGYIILFVSGDERIADPSLDRLQATCAGVYTRANLGRDFGSWQFGLNHLGALENLDWLLLANDSVFGPFFDLGQMATEMERRELDFWGVTDCYQGKWHLQSYFLSFRGDIVRSETFQSFFAKGFAGLTKQEIIDQGEVALSQDLLGAGYRGAAYCPYEALDGGRYDFSRNPMHHYWDKLIAGAHCPFLKIELLRDNPLKIQNIEHFREVISTASSYEIRLIEEYLDTSALSRQRTGLPKTG